MRIKWRLVMFGICIAAANSSLRAEVSAWDVLRHRLFGARPLHEDSAVIALYAPRQAEDAAAVPITLTLGGDAAGAASRLWLVVDRNPSPLAAAIEFGPAYRQGAVGERRLETRLRVDAFSMVRAVFETRDGRLYHSAVFVAGAGGCSAPGHAAAGDVRAGRYRLATRADAGRGRDWREVLVSIEHPNFTGLQRDAQGRVIPARYIDRISVGAGATSLLELRGGISIAENPQLRFSYAQGATPLPIALHGADSSGLALQAAQRAPHAGAGGN